MSKELPTFEFDYRVIEPTEDIQKTPPTQWFFEKITVAAVKHVGPLSVSEFEREIKSGNVVAKTLIWSPELTSNKPIHAIAVPFVAEIIKNRDEQLRDKSRPARIANAIERTQRLNARSGALGWILVVFLLIGTAAALVFSIRSLEFATHYSKQDEFGRTHNIVDIADFRGRVFRRFDRITLDDIDYGSMEGKVNHNGNFDGWIKFTDKRGESWEELYNDGKPVEFF